MKYLNKTCSLAICILMLTTILSCKKYLDAKPNQSLVTPSSLEDLQALLDNNEGLNLGNYQGLSELGADDYYVSYSAYASRQDYDQKCYIWNDAASEVTLANWYYSPVFICNTVLDEIPKITEKNGATLAANHIKGSALFFRGFSFYWLAQSFCKPYSQNDLNAEPGIPLRLSPNFNVPSTRGTVQQTYDQIISDFKSASTLLPLTSDSKMRPNKVAALAALARTYLAMEDYDKAGTYADSALQINKTLIDYNQFNASSNNPFPVFNEEMIFYAASGISTLLSASRAFIDSTLYQSYHVNDVRKTLFFRSRGAGKYSFKGSYGGFESIPVFNGFANDELYLIRAECLARSGSAEAAIKTLNELLVKRWKTGTFVPFSAANPDQALSIILQERRKQLLFRNARWTDLRRLNRDPRFARTLKRVLVNGANTMTHTLPPNDLRYVFLLPADVISLTGMPQNPR
ncbi:RagB/SusD family nutrient uptake outer membrane protein [Pedobacter psychroterrae]|uniref:RagB/SusD family nutrient uptake outer membrane protein n=1 Tax=Pedobacter psychroterrae TaxID=2530453 RepID=A0A4R0NRC3_9SPHI|nr:RagB/SusD family nutrient uptake outer membrane protein [Pedobacter psychroterrae]TCD02729.1 RagB/SusD family nutrient uptake outer membrane protein [Pedobacter psychroterrae]